MKRARRHMGGRGTIVPCLLLAAVLLQAVPVAAEPDGTRIQAPREPSDPTVDAGGKRSTAAEADVTATVITAKGEPMTGSLLLPFDTIEAETAEKGPEGKKSFPLASIKTLEFTRWRGTLRRKNEYAFYPVLMKITLRDGKAYQCSRVTPALNRLLFKDYRGRRVLYAYFFDYRDGKKWKNSGEADMAYPDTSPAAGTVVRIEFAAAGMKGPLDWLFK